MWVLSLIYPTVLGHFIFYLFSFYFCILVWCGDSYFKSPVINFNICVTFNIFPMKPLFLQNVFFFFPCLFGMPFDFVVVEI